MTTTQQLLEDKTALADFLDRRLSCICDDQLNSLVSGSQLMQTLVNLHHVSGTFDRCILNLAHTIVVQPEFVQDESISAQLAARRSVEIYRQLATGSDNAKRCHTHTALERQQVARAFMAQAPASMGLGDMLIEPTDVAIRQAQLIEQTLSPGRPMTEQEFFQALGFYLSWSNFCNVQFRTLKKFLQVKAELLVDDLENTVVKTFYGTATAFSWIQNTIDMSEQNFAATAKAVLLLLDYYVGDTDTDILCYWLMSGIKSFDAFQDKCLIA